MAADPLEDPDARLKGIEARYDVKKINDPTGKHDECAYFVLDPQHDPIAALAMSAYAKEARRRGFVPLANDLERWLQDVDPSDEIDRLLASAKEAAHAGEDVEAVLAERRARIDRERES